MVHPALPICALKATCAAIVNMGPLPACCPALVHHVLASKWALIFNEARVNSSGASA
jgi:hypothetical protein